MLFNLLWTLGLSLSARAAFVSRTNFRLKVDSSPCYRISAALSLAAGAHLFVFNSETWLNAEASVEASVAVSVTVVAVVAVATVAVVAVVPVAGNEAPKMFKCPSFCELGLFPEDLWPLH